MMKVLIAGLAKTGTTGLLYLISNSFGKKPKLLFEPKVCPPDANGDSGDLVAKILMGKKLDVPSFAHFDKKITIVRDPRDRAVSALLYSQYHANYLEDEERVGLVRECLERKEANPANVSIREILEVIGSVTGKSDIADKFWKVQIKLLTVFEDYVTTIPDGLLYKYEDFVSGEYGQLEKHLGMRIKGAAEVPDSLNRVNRTKGYGDWRNWFTREDVDKNKQMFMPWLKKYGYDADDWLLNARPVIDRAHCSGYFMRLVEEQRKRSASSGKSVTENETGNSEGRLLIGKILRAEPGVVAGWAIGADPDKPVRVALLVNGKEIAQMVADKPRQGLKEHGIHPTGRCGFQFHLGPDKLLRAGDKVSVDPIGHSFTLEPSQWIVA